MRVKQVNLKIRLKKQIILKENTGVDGTQGTTNEAPRIVRGAS